MPLYDLSTHPIPRPTTSFAESDVPASQSSAGALVLIGGACEATGEALGRFLDLAEARSGGQVVGITTASSFPVKSALAWRSEFTRAGARDAYIPIVASHTDANEPELAERVADASGIFLGGGDQRRLAQALRGTRLERAIRDAHARGATVCGTSAGSAALSATMFAGGEMDETGGWVPRYVGPGFGLLGFGTVVDTHFTQRRRLQRLFGLVAERPELWGLGIDEDTALVVGGSHAEVFGAGTVTSVDGRGAWAGPGATVAEIRVTRIGPGCRLDLLQRRVEGCPTTPQLQTAPDPVPHLPLAGR